MSCCLNEYLMPMKSKFFQFLRCNSFLLVPLFVLSLAGCKSVDNPALMAPPTGEYSGDPAVARLHIGDTITISFDGLPELLPTQEKTINEDGTISLSDIGSVKAVGKTTGQLETAIHDGYVPKYYTHLTVTVKAGDRVFYVRGEVKNPGRQIYVGQTSVAKAITAAGDFTDFANRGKIWLIRANGQRFKIDCEAIMNGETQDPPVYPGDQIEVTRRLF